VSFTAKNTSTFFLVRVMAVKVSYSYFCTNFPLNVLI
jgi:hypothetical protein